MLFLLLAVIVMFTNVSAYDFSDNSTGIMLYYTINGNNVTVTHPNSSMPYWTNQPSGSLIIPFSVYHEGRTYTVTGIDNNTFADCIYLTSIEIPNTVINIGWYAFSGCTALYSITMSDTVITIGDHAFYGCTSLTNITLPNTLTSIENYLFYDCSSLARINIPNSVNSIGLYAFGDCTSLDSIIISPSVTCIGNMAFLGCSGLHHIEIGAGVNTIGYSAFSGCGGLTSICMKNQYPPVIQNNTFPSTFTFVPKTIPCGSINFYQSANNWSSFANYTEDCGNTVTVVSADEEMGLVHGGGVYQDGDTVVIRAAAFGGYRFDHWNDTITANPHKAIVTGNVTFTAYFVPANDTTERTEIDTVFVHDTIYVQPEYYEISVFSGNVQRGLVAGNGLFPDSTFVEIAAIPIEGSRFIQWQDGNTDNPRLVQIIGSDADYIATFDQGTSVANVAIDDIFQVTSSNGQIVVSNVAGQWIRLFDFAGHIISTVLSTDDTYTFDLLTSGVYFVQVGEAMMAQRVIIVNK